MPWPVHPNGLLGAQGDENDSYRIERSLRFNSADSAYLNRTPASAGNRKTWTWSGWVKRSNLGTTQVFYSASETGSSSQLFFDTSDRINIFSNVASINVVSTPRYRDVSSWYHIVVSLDTAQATASDRVKLYVNGTRVTAFEGSTYYPAQNAEPSINNTVIHALGAQVASGSITAGVYLSSYLTEIHFIDGQALTPSSFGETDAITGRWKAKAYSGTYGTNGFYLKFADNSGTTSTTLGKDSSPNGNNWTPNNFSVTAGAGNDSLVDSPTNYGIDTGVGGEVRGNYCTINPLKTNSSITISDGNLKTVKSAASNNLVEFGSVGVNTGKWYWEMKPTSIGGFYYIGIGKDAAPNNTYPNANDVFTYGNNGNKYNGASEVAYGSSFTANDVIGIALDCNSGTLVFYKNNTSQGTAFSSGISGNTWFPYAFPDGTNNSHTTEWNFGQRPFAYTAPTGFKALCTTNLTTPTIKKPSSYFDAVTYTGTGASNSISSLGFSPDLVWIKNRGGATSHAIYDTTRGTQAQLSSDTTGSEATSSTGLTAFGSNGFTIGTSTLVNTSGTQYVAWGWDEAPIAGMDIVSYTGNGDTSSTRDLINHNLGVSPKMIIYKRRDAAGSWVFWHSGLSSVTQSYLLLQSTDAVASSSPNTVQGTPSATAFRPRWTDASSGNNINNATYIAYLFAEVEGFSKIGSYTGNGSADGPFVWCGFRPRYALFKYTGGVANWTILDSARNQENVADDYLIASGSSAEATGFDAVDFVSNGIKIRYSGTSLNASGGTIIFAAFAESPFKYARAR